MKTIIEEREYTYEEITNILFSLAEKYKFLNIYSIGKTVTGKPIYAAQLGISPDYILYAGAFHGMERLTSLTLMMFLEEYCENLLNDTNYDFDNARSALFGKTLIIIPVVNPDGYSISLKGASAAGNFAESVKAISNNNTSIWNANARGVDINHNFNAGFNKLHELEKAQGITGPAPGLYGGPIPESEPETKALTEFCRTHNVKYVLAFHSQGEEIYWQYGKNTPDKAFRMAELFATTSNYALSTPTGTASYGGFKDWFIDEFSRPGFTIEIGKGRNPLPSSDLYEIYFRLKGLFYLSIVL